MLNPLVLGIIVGIILGGIVITIWRSHNDLVNAIGKYSLFSLRVLSYI
jgi:hypothetical protein